MKDWVRHALTKTVGRKGPRGKQQIVLVEPDENIVLLVKFAIAIVLCLSAVEVVSLIFLHTFDDAVFSAITALVGTVTGVLIGYHV
jgi:hypothetical protein